MQPEISIATARNWSRLNVDVSEKLTARANKRLSKKIILPTEYFSSNENLSIVTEILAFIKDPLNDVTQTACINCGRCVEICPGRVVPTKLAKLAAKGDMEGFLKNYGLECCECGCCSYICPAKRDLTQAIKTMRKRALAQRKK